MKNLVHQDKLIADAVRQELARQQNKIELIASENFVSQAVMEATGTVLANKYAEGYPAKRYYGGCEYVDLVEELAIHRAKELLVPIMSTYSLILARRQIWLFILLQLSLATPF